MTRLRALGGKLNSIKLYRESGKKMEEVAQNLGIPKSTLYVWVQEFKKHGEDSFPGNGQLKPCNEELYQLKKQLAEVTMERDILKKAAAIFSTGNCFE
jgi:transposase